MTATNYKTENEIPGRGEESGSTRFQDSTWIEAIASSPPHPDEIDPAILDCRIAGLIWILN